MSWSCCKSICFFSESTSTEICTCIVKFVILICPLILVAPICLYPGCLYCRGCPLILIASIRVDRGCLYLGCFYSPWFASLEYQYEGGRKGIAKCLVHLRMKQIYLIRFLCSTYTKILHWVNMNLGLVSKLRRISTYHTCIPVVIFTKLSTEFPSVPSKGIQTSLR